MKINKIINLATYSVIAAGIGIFSINMKKNIEDVNSLKQLIQVHETADSHLPRRPRHIHDSDMEDVGPLSKKQVYPDEELEKRVLRIAKQGYEACMDSFSTPAEMQVFNKKVLGHRGINIDKVFYGNTDFWPSFRKMYEKMRLVGKDSLPKIPSDCDDAVIANAACLHDNGFKTYPMVMRAADGANHVVSVYRSEGLFGSLGINPEDYNPPTHPSTRDIAQKIGEGLNFVVLERDVYDLEIEAPGYVDSGRNLDFIHPTKDRESIDRVLGFLCRQKEEGEGKVIYMMKDGSKIKARADYSILKEMFSHPQISCSSSGFSFHRIDRTDRFGEIEYSRRRVRIDPFYGVMAYCRLAPEKRRTLIPEGEWKTPAHFTDYLADSLACMEVCFRR